MPHAGIDELRGHRTGRGGVVAGEKDLGGARDLPRVAADGGAVVVEHAALAADLLDADKGRAGDVPDVGVLRDDPEGPLAVAADQDRGVRALDRLGFADRTLELVVAPVEVEWASVHMRRMIVHDSASAATPSPGVTSGIP